MSHAVCLVKGEQDRKAKGRKEEINFESTLQVTFICFSLIHQSSVIWLSSLGLAWKGGIYCTVSQDSDLQNGGHGLYPRREQGTRKRGGGTCESLCRGINMLYITNSFPATPLGAFLEETNLLHVYLLYHVAIPEIWTSKWTINWHPGSLYTSFFLE